MPTDILHRIGFTISGEWIEAWCGCGWKYNPPETDGTRLDRSERLREAHDRGHDHIEDTTK